MKKIRKFLVDYIKSIKWLPVIVIILILNILLLFEPLSWKSFLTLNGAISLIIVASFIIFKIRKKYEN